MANLFNKPFEDISFEDIEDLVVNQKREENECLDYKEKFNPQDFDKLISAFANTYGGFIIVGVREEKGTSRPEKIVTVKQTDLENSIDSICFDKINPPIFCERRYLPKDRPKIFIIKVEESDLAPHAVDFNTLVYLKIKAQKRSDPVYRRANIEEIDWLKNRRQRYIEIRSQLIERSAKRFSRIIPKDNDHRLFSIFYTTPKFPRKLLPNDRALQDFVRNIDRNGMGLVRSLNLRDIKTAAGSVASYRQSDFGHSYDELNIFGMYCNVTIFEPYMNRQDGGKVNNLFTLAANLAGNIIIGLEYLKYLGYRGSSIIHYSLCNMLGKSLKIDEYIETRPFDIDLVPEIDNNFLYEKEINFTDERVDYLSIFSEILDNIVCAANGGYDHEARLIYQFAKTIYEKCVR